MGGEGEGLLVRVAGDMRLESRAAAPGAGAEGVVDGEGAARALAGKIRGGRGGVEEEKDGSEEKKGGGEV